MFRDRVVEHYRVRGYKVHENVKVRGRSGSVHACDIVAQGPLGNIIVSFGDAGGFEGPELAAVRSAAQDIGGAAVVAVPRAPQPVLDAARTLGVKILDEAAVAASHPVTRAEEAPEFAVHPWPDEVRRSRREDPQTDLWKHQRSPPVAKPDPPKADGFAWLKAAGPGPVPEQTPTTPEAHPDLTEPVQNVVHVPVIREVQKPRFDWKWVVVPAVYGVVTALVLFLFLALFL